MKKSNSSAARRISMILLIAMVLTSYAQATETSAKPDSTTQKNKIGWFRRTFAELTWDEVGTIVNSPKEISRRIYTRVTYVKDEKDLLSAPEDTWKRKTGDCEDLAACVVDLCAKKNIEAWIHIFYEAGNKDAHAVAMGYWDGKLWMSSNGWHMRVDSIKDAGREVAREMGWERDLVSSGTWASLKGESVDNGLSTAAQ